MALACDLIVAADNAKFAMSYLKAGLTPDGGASHALFNLLPRQIALELLLDAAPISSQRLHQLGVVNRVTAPGKSRDGALEWAIKISRGPQKATRRLKPLAHAAAHNILSSQHSH